jgi:hypothetical protein
MKKKMVFLLFPLLMTFFSLAGSCRSETEEDVVSIDSRSFNLGVIAAFAEIVSMDVKKLALSAPLSPSEMDELIADAERIANENDVSVYIEKDFLTTDLFSEELTADKYVLLICKPPAKEEYAALKKEKRGLVESGEYTGEARTQIARKMGRLLSYPENKIDELLKEK